MLFAWNYRPNGPLYLTLVLDGPNNVRVDLYVKRIDPYHRHNCFLRLRDGNIDIQTKRLLAYDCPRCEDRLNKFRYEDKYNVLFCSKCNYEAWSNKIYY